VRGKAGALADDQPDAGADEADDEGAPRAAEVAA
jgi:hypothetical protein